MATQGIKKTMNASILGVCPLKEVLKLVPNAQGNIKIKTI